METPEPGAAPKAEPDISKEESQRVAELIDEGLLLVDAALGAGHEGDSCPQKQDTDESHSPSH